jgi:hypothetical protein
VVVVSLKNNGKALIQALNDKEIQDIAWKKHGFRSGVAGVTNDPQDLLPAKVPAEIKSTLDLPQPAVIDWIVEQLAPGS